MRNIISNFVLSLWFITSISNAQDITSTLAPNGSFKIKDVTTDYLSLSQSTGFLSLNRSLVLPNTTSPSVGVIFKGADRFLHNYGLENTFIGINSGNFTMTGSNNTALGFQSLFSNTIGFSNTANGDYTLFSNTLGSSNTANGSLALYSNTIGDNNTANGFSVLYSNTTGFNNTGNGFAALYLNTTGSYNTANGMYALNSNTTGSYSTANGYQALLKNTEGYNNTATGSHALYFNTTGHENTAIGYQALYSNTIGSQNTANGLAALYSNTTGYRNTATGYGALVSNTTGFSNSALGYGSGNSITTGSNLTCLGHNAQPTAPDAINQITLGNGFVSSLRCNVTTITSLSDARDKKNITDLALGLDFITKLKPRQFNWDKREWYDDNISDGSKMKEEPTAGFIAQELDEAQTREDVEWLNLVLKDNTEKWEATPGNLLPIMVKAIQELAIKNEELTIKNERLKIEKDEEVAELKTRLVKYEEMQVILVKKIEQIDSSERALKVQLVNSENNNQ